MALIRWGGMPDPFAEMDEFFNRLPMAQNMSAMSKAFVPAMDMYETKDAVVVEMPLAGIDPKDVGISVEKGVLTVQGETSKEHEVEEKNYYRKEVRGGSFFRQVALPMPVKEDEVNAEFADGILRITAPKTAPTKAKKIDVKIVKKNAERK
jgi:HSP20 family protein